jgi:hypothetical protein
VIKGITQEKFTRWYAVTGEGPVARNHASTTIVPEVLEVTWTRTVKHGWVVFCLDIAGQRAKADGTPGGQALTATWYHNPTAKAPGGRWTGSVEPPLWATLTAVNDTPEDGPLADPSTTITPVDLDNLTDHTEGI